MLVIRCVLTQPNPNYHRIVLPWATRLQTSSCVLMWMMALNLDSIYHKVNKDQKVNEETGMAVTLAWMAGTNNTHFDIGAKYKLASLPAKVNNASLI